MMNTIPLFPLSSVLFPGGRLPLQIFEPRYLDLVSDSLKNDSGFGVVWLRRGGEVHAQQGDQPTALSPLGTYARIVDWTKLDNGLLGITIEGREKFRLLSSQQQANQLYIGEVEWLPQEPAIAMNEQSDELHGLLQQLLHHPHLQRLQVASEINDIGQLSCLLCQYLPLEEAEKFLLLSEFDPLQRLEQLMQILDRFAE